MKSLKKNQAKIKPKSKLAPVKTKSTKSRNETRQSASVLLKSKTKSSSSKREDLLSRKNQKGKASQLKRKQRVQASVDAWDTGAAERAEDRAVRVESGTKRLKFEPAAATLVLPSREDLLKQQFGEFAGPLLGTLYDESQAHNSVSFEPLQKPKTTKSTGTKNGNIFNVLGSSSEDEGDDLPTKKIVFKPSTLGDASTLPVPSALPPQFAQSSAAAAGQGLFFKPATFNVNASGVNPSRMATTISSSPPILFKPSTIAFINNSSPFGANLGGARQTAGSTTEENDFEDL